MFITQRRTKYPSQTNMTCLLLFWFFKIFFLAFPVDLARNNWHYLGFDKHIDDDNDDGSGAHFATVPSTDEFNADRYWLRYRMLCWCRVAAKALGNWHHQLLGH